MGRQAQCPACGAPVEFRSVVSVLAVCDFCRSTLLRTGASIENLGKMAELLEDRSPLQRGSEGRWRGVHFALIGRIQLKYEQGLWNEWHLLFDDGRSGWLSEAGGEYVLSLPQSVSEPVPAFDAIAVGQQLLLDGRRFYVSNKLSAECVAGEGELPFRVGAGYAAPVVDLRNETNGFATLDYSDSTDRPWVFIGESIAFDSLGWTMLRDPASLPQPTVKARAFNCPNCGGACRIEHADIVSVGCTSCGALLDTGSDEVRLVARIDAQLKQPRLPLGSRGNLRGEAVEVIGYMRRCMRADGVEYCWSEYVGLGKDNALLWLTEYDGHWNIARVLKRSVAATTDKIVFDKQIFRHFQTYQARVQMVLGEFPWRVRADETARVFDYVAPPQMLSNESTDSEITWTLADYVEPAEIEAAFALKHPLPERRGVYANQPNPHEAVHRSVCRRFWLLLLLSVGIYLLLMLAGPWKVYVRQPMSFSPADDEPQLTREFRLDGVTPRLEISHDTNLANNWIGFSMTLVNKDTGENWQVAREVSRYEGVDDGERWSEGSRSDAVVFRDLPAGTYLLAIEADMDDGSPPVTTTLQVERSGPRLSSLLLVAVFLAIFPIFTRIRNFGFEVRRWADSDHPIVTEGEGDDD